MYTDAVLHDMHNCSSTVSRIDAQYLQCGQTDGSDSKPDLLPAVIVLAVVLALALMAIGWLWLQLPLQTELASGMTLGGQHILLDEKECEREYVAFNH